ncbi:MAG: hypothetical protein HQ538_03625 [Parcubacteria group bacterium]|nr:hypothetical protein [Parcubacteria group bacterium]
MSNTKSKILKILYDHWLIILKVALTLGGLSLVIYLRDLLMSAFHKQIPVWLVVGGLVCFYLPYLLFRKLLSKKKKMSPGIMFVTPPPIYRKGDLGTCNIGGVIWSFWVGSDTLFEGLMAGKQTRRIWADGPFCLQCPYELDRDFDKNRWMCMKCGGKFGIPKNLETDTRKKVIKIFEAELRSPKNEK